MLAAQAHMHVEDLLVCQIAWYDHPQLKALEPHVPQLSMCLLACSSHRLPMCSTLRTGVVLLLNLIIMITALGPG